MAIVAEPTPNPNSMKFTVGKPVIDSGSRTFTSKEEAGEHAAAQLFDLVGIASIFLLNDFITVTKADSASWDVLTTEIRETLEQIYT